ncbi:hypothetical protein ABUK73_04255 [Agrobacterium sp. BA1120]|uniref:hypothetical protein n=1 Tax=Agrobacterium sp. BA1120 TaxID=3228927 RepID=UPI00336A85E3
MKYQNVPAKEKIPLMTCWTPLFTLGSVPIHAIRFGFVMKSEKMHVVACRESCKAASLRAKNKGAAPLGLPPIFVRSRYAEGSDLFRSACDRNKAKHLLIQDPFSCTPLVYAEIENTLSRVRLSRYMPAAKNDPQFALRLYVWNVRLCECLYLPIQFTEVATRNAILKPVQKRFSAQWYQNPKFENILPPRLRDELREAVRKETRKHGVTLSGDHVVSALSLGFWVALMGKAYDKHLWHNGIKGSFPYAQKAIGRSQIHSMLEDMRKLRNDVMHHAALFDKTPQAKLADVMGLLALISHETEIYVKTLSTLNSVINQRPQC